MLGDGLQLSLDEKVRSVARGLKEKKVHFFDERADQVVLEMV